MGEILMACIVTNQNPLIWLLRLSTVDRRDPIWFQKCCMIFMIDVMIWFTIWFPSYVCDGFVRVPQPRKANATNSHAVITKWLTFCDLDPWGWI